MKYLSSMRKKYVKDLHISHDIYIMLLSQGPHEDAYSTETDNSKTAKLRTTTRMKEDGYIPFEDWKILSKDVFWRPYIENSNKPMPDKHLRFVTLTKREE